MGEEMYIMTNEHMNRRPLSQGCRPGESEAEERGERELNTYFFKLHGLAI